MAAGPTECRRGDRGRHLGRIRDVGSLSAADIDERRGRDARKPKLRHFLFSQSLKSLSPVRRADREHATILYYSARVRDDACRNVAPERRFFFGGVWAVA